ncbi:hypothetical protein [Catenuloplanes indicus]|uniref:Uncharacterized protein n=1 Tax=Catenuloplanes indicus TaxID=137267 RepID=A0AAE3W0V4_9ACTN|nr:hypothetical protein [Catenuloplanes indicus]MDQ0366862.1 hypothetical protein [Catenuloplanes indicus]
MSEHQFQRGDRVICNPDHVAARYHGIVWTIDRIGPVNAFLTHPHGGVGLKVPPALLLPAPDDTDTTAAAAEVVPLPLELGAVVTVASPTWRGGTDPHVVLKDNGDTLRIVRLGGAGNRYWPKIPRAWLTEVNPDRVRASVAAIARESR